MIFILSLIFALCASAIIASLGWRRTTNQAEISSAMGVTPRKNGFDGERFARQTGTGLKFNQIVFGFLTWALGGFLLGILMGPVAAILFAIAGGLMYSGNLTDLRETFRLRQAEDILRAVGTMASMLESGEGELKAIQEAAKGCSPIGQMVMNDLYLRISNQTQEVIVPNLYAWAARWDHPAVDIFATVLIASKEKADSTIRTLPMLENLRTTLSAILNILTRARKAASGIEWQTKFLTIYPPVIVLFASIIVPDLGRIYSANPLLLMPILLGSGACYFLTMNLIHKKLSLEASMGLQDTGARTDQRVAAPAVTKVGRYG